MKTVIAATLFAFASTGALADSFAYEQAIGTPNLFPTLESSSANVSYSVDDSFAYERAVGTTDLFPTLESSGSNSVSSDVFAYERNIGTSNLFVELDV